MYSTHRRSILLALFTISPGLAIADQPAGTTQREGRPISNPRFDPAARRVPLFDGIDAGSLSAQVIADGPAKGVVLVTNHDSEVLTVDLPDSFVAVHVLKQFGQIGNNQPSIPGVGSIAGQNGGGGGGQQSIGGGFSGPQTGASPSGANGSNNGNGFFSVPPAKTVKVKFLSTCLEHGKPDPSPHAAYALVRTEAYTPDPVLRHLLKLVGRGRVPENTAQAAVWHLTDNMSWSQLAAKFSWNLGRRVPYFTSREIKSARVLVTQAQGATRSAAPQPTTVAEASDRLR